MRREAPPTPASHWLFLLLSAADWPAGLSVAGGGRRGGAARRSRSSRPAGGSRRPAVSAALGPAPGLASLGLAPSSSSSSGGSGAPRGRGDEGDRGLRGVPEGLAALQVLPGRSRDGAVWGDGPRWGPLQGGGEGAAAASRAAGTAAVGAPEGDGELWSRL